MNLQRSLRIPARLWTAFGLVVSLSVACSAKEGAATSAANRKPATDFALKDLAGKEVKLSQFRGKVVILDFWATWCPPCRKGIPDLIELQKAHQKQGLEVIGVSFDQNGAAAVKPFVEKNGVNYTMLLGGLSIGSTWVPTGKIPTSYVLDKKGRIVSSWVGLVTKQTFEELIVELLKEG